MTWDRKYLFPFFFREWRGSSGFDFLFDDIEWQVDTWQDQIWIQKTDIEMDMERKMDGIYSFNSTSLYSDVEVVDRIVIVAQNCH